MSKPVLKEIDPVGGQAVINGVMMRSKDKLVVAVRKNKKIITKTIKIKKRAKLLGKPFIRGVFNFFEMLSLGFKALNWSAEQMDDEKITKKETFIAFSTAIIFVIGIFIVLPFFITKMLTPTKGLFFNFIDGIIRIGFFLAYVLIISNMKDVKELFMYHGAEHKAVHCFEEKCTLNPKSAKKHRKEHPRCGTAYIMIVFVISILVFSVIMTGRSFTDLLIRLLLIPIILSISYELLKLSAKHQKNPLLKLLIMPGMLFQKLTTKNPTEKQLEVAIYALKKVVR